MSRNALKLWSEPMMQEQGPYAVSAAAIFRSIKGEKVKALLHVQIQLDEKMGM